MLQQLPYCSLATLENHLLGLHLVEEIITFNCVRQRHDLVEHEAVDLLVSP